MDYSKKSKEELIREIEFLKNETSSISKVLYNIKEMFYKISFDKNGNKVIDYISPQVQNVLGLTTEEYINNKNILFEHFHPEEIDDLVEATKKIGEEKKEWNFTYRFYHKHKKQYVWINETIIPEFDNKGKKTGLLGTAKDVTDSKNKDKQLEFILENIEECIYNVKFNNGEKKLNFVSNTIQKITGLSPKEFEKEGKTGELIKRIHPDDVDMVNDHIDTGLYKNKKGQLYSVFRFKPKGKKDYLWIEESVYTNFNKKGEITETTTVLRDITRIKDSEQKLIESEERYRTFSNLSNEIVIIHDNGIVKEINNAVFKVLGYKPEELLEKSMIKLATKKTAEVVKKNIKNNYTKPYEVVGFHKNGEKVNIQVTGKSIVWKGKKMRVATMLDITARKTFETHLKENEEKYRNIFTKNMAGVFITDNGNIIECNNSFAKIFGYKSRVQLIGKPAEILYFNKKDRNNYLKDLNKKNTLSNYRIRHKKADGEELWILTNVTKKGTRIEGTLIEITDEVRQEELNKEKIRVKIAEETNKKLQKEINERVLAEEKLKENQKYTQSIIDNSLDIICASDINGNIIEFNKSGTKIFGYKPKEALTIKAVSLYANKKDFYKVGKQLKEKGTFVGEVENKRKNGEKFTSFLSASLLYDQQGNVIGSMGISRDITDLKEAEKQLIESEEKYRDLFENATDLIQSVDVKGNILYVNNAWKDKLGYTDKEILNKNIFEIIHPDCTEKCKEIFEKIINSKSNKTNKVSYELKTKQGKKITVEGNVSLRYKDGKPESTRAILRDITDEIWDKTLQTVYNNVAKIITEKNDSEVLYESIRKELGKVINTDVFSISYKLDNDLLTFPYYYDITRKGRLEAKNRYKKKGLNEYIIEKGKSFIMHSNEWNKIIAKGNYKLFGPEAKVFVGVPLKIKNEVIGVVAVQSYTNRNEYNEKTIEILEFISGVLALTVQRKYDEAKIYEQTSRLKAIIESSSHLFWTFQPNTGLTSFNKNYSDSIFDLYGKRPEIEKENKTHPNKIISFWEEKYKEAIKGKKVEFTVNRKNKKGVDVITEIFLNPIYDDKGNVSEISGIGHDITEKILAEEKLKESLKEKEILLKEVHHRVKNNLQVISSILNLQSSYVKDEKTLNILKESQNRIKSMAFIHESLYQTNDFSKIDFSEYVISLSKNLVHSYELFDNFVSLKLDVKNVSLNLDQSIPCGLLINELISNALKYAFPKKEKGTITVKLYEKEETVYLKVKDDGVGLPKDIDYRNTESLGLQLVMTLTEQIGGNIELDNSKGANYNITFKKD